MNNNRILKRVHERLEQQSEKGLVKYGTLVNSADYSLLGWQEHELQELSDALVYKETAKEKVKTIIQVLKGAKTAIEDESYEYGVHLINKAIGFLGGQDEQ